MQSGYVEMAVNQRAYYLQYKEFEQAARWTDQGFYICDDVLDGEDGFCSFCRTDPTCLSWREMQTLLRERSSLSLLVESRLALVDPVGVYE